jgi:hypothetical protein
MRPMRVAATGVVNGIFDALRGDEREHVRRVLLVRRNHVNEDLHLVLEALGKQRANRAVDDPRREDLSVAGAPFALDVAAGDLPRGVRLLAILHEEREEVERALRVAHRDGGEHHGVAELNEGGTGGLLGHATRLDDEAASGEGLFNAMHHCLCA